ncbi:MAG: adenylate/guanylate cyclase domain-containing protein [Planctomycetaceae bacterium]|nr:adenylate/guanylate cyclase domain-containing protein [Planctomycetaceae bacterium]
MAVAEPRLAELIVKGPAGEEFRRKLIEGRTVRIGRSPTDGWAIAWDRTISREHADMCWKDGKLSVTCLENAGNPIKLKGTVHRKISVGGSEPFDIGLSSFYVAVERMSRIAKPVQWVEFVRESDGRSPGPTANGNPKEVFETHDSNDDVEEHSYKSHELQNVEFGDTKRQMELLSKLPQMISDSKSDVDLALMLCGMLLDAIPPAAAVAVTVFEESDVLGMRSHDDPNAAIPKPKLMRVQTRDNFEGRFMPSRRLLRKALRQGESAMHIVTETDEGGAQFTIASSFGWAFCAPISAPSCLGWCLYVSGAGGREGNLIVTEEDLKGDLRFTQLVSQLIGSIRTVRTLQEQTTQLSAFFSPKVIANLTKKGGAADILVPSRRDISVLFCDVRGFSRKSEQLQDDLEQLLDCVKAALSAMTGGILAFDGSIADFQGDAALGFWGWPAPLEDGPISACRAALAIMQAFRLPLEEQGLLEGFSCGVGIAHGQAIAGQVGTTQQAKIGVFGPVVNQGSRIEGMTRMFGVDICIDEATANFVRRLMPPEEGRVRRLARVRPKGMDTAIEVSELLPPEIDAPHFTTEIVSAHELAVAHVITGQWKEAIEYLQSQVETDSAAKFLLDHMALSDNQPPADWDGAFRLVSK